MDELVYPILPPLFENGVIWRGTPMPRFKYHAVVLREGLLGNPRKLHVVRMCSVVKDEFKLTNVWLNYSKPETFYTSQWRFPWPVFLIYRLAVAVYVTCAFIMMVVNWEMSADDRSKHRHNVMAYLTTWTYLTLTLNMVLAAFIVIWCNCRARSQSHTETTITNVETISANYVYCENNRAFSKEDDNCDINSNTNFENKHNNFEKSDIKLTNTNDFTPDHVVSLHVQEPTILESTMPWYLKLSWVLWNIVSVDALLVTAIYFGALYNKIQLERGHPGLDFDNLNIHALNSVFVFVDVIVSARPVRLLHVIYPVMYSVVYVIFSIIYWWVDHSNVLYKRVLDWNNVGFTAGVVVVVAVVILPALQCFYFVLYRLRLLIYKKICSANY